MPSIQRRSSLVWEAGTADERRRAAEALRALLGKKSEADRAARERDERKETFRAGGARAAAIVWIDALSQTWDALDGRVIPQIRNVATWKPSGKTADPGRMRLSLARHLYGRYRTPAFLDAMWLADIRPQGGPVRPVMGGDAFRRRGSPDLAFATIWKAVAGGVSLHKACLAPRGLLSRKETHLFLQAPDWCEVAQAMWWARILSATGSAPAADVVARSRLVDFSGDARQGPDPRWVAVARFVAAQVAPDMRGDELAETMDWVRAMMAASRTWGIEGRTLATVRRASRDWHKLQARQKAWSREHWEGYPIDAWSWDENEPGEKNHRAWKVEQILDGKTLAAEGHAQRHCVGSYIGDCRSGKCAILSLTVRDNVASAPRRALTVEVNRNWRIVQAKAFANRAPDGAERRALQRFAAENGISWD